MCWPPMPALTLTKCWLLCTEKARRAKRPKRPGESMHMPAPFAFTACELASQLSRYRYRSTRAPANQRGITVPPATFDRPISNEMIAKMYDGLVNGMREWYEDLYHVVTRIRAREEGTPDPGTLLEAEQTVGKSRKWKKLLNSSLLCSSSC